MEQFSELKVKIIGQTDIIFKNISIQCKISELQEMIIDKLMDIDINYGCLNKNQIKILYKGSVIPTNCELNKISDNLSSQNLSLIVVLPKIIPQILNGQTDYSDDSSKFWIDLEKGFLNIGVPISNIRTFISSFKNKVENNLNDLNNEAIENLLNTRMHIHDFE